MPNDNSSFWMQITRPEVLGEVIAVVTAVVLAAISSRMVVAWHRRNGRRLAGTGWRARLLEGATILTPYLIALVLLSAIQWGLRKAEVDVATLDVAIMLIAALIAVRLGVYFVRMMVGPDSWVKAWETRLTLFFWLGVSFELLGWFNRIESTLDSIDLIPGKATFTLWALLKGIIVVTGFVLVTSVIARAIERRVMTIESLAPSTRIGIAKFSQFFLIGLGILLGINAAGVDLTALTVLTGAIGIGLGFGLQAIASNFVSGFVLLLDKSIKPGDVISFTGHTGTSTENFGWVQELRGRFVVVRDRDGVETLVPNQNLITNSVINWSYSDQRVRLRLPVLISYDDDPELALDLLVQAAAEHPRILKDPAPVSRLLAFDDYGMRLEARFWIRDPMNGVNNVRSDVNRVIWRIFRQHGIKIPVAQREIRILDGAGRGRLADNKPAELAPAENDSTRRMPRPTLDPSRGD
jgi:small-conductance mechanosensitive channel